MFARNAALEKKKKILFRKFIHVDTIIIASVIQRLTGNEVINTLKGETFADYKVFNINFLIGIFIFCLHKFSWMTVFKNLFEYDLLLVTSFEDIEITKKKNCMYLPSVLCVCYSFSNVGNYNSHELLL